MYSHLSGNGYVPIVWVDLVYGLFCLGGKHFSQLTSIPFNVTYSGELCSISKRRPCQKRRTCPFPAPPSSTPHREPDRTFGGSNSEQQHDQGVQLANKNPTPSCSVPRPKRLGASVSSRFLAVGTAIMKKAEGGSGNPAGEALSSAHLPEWHFNQTRPSGIPPPPAISLLNARAVP